MNKYVIILIIVLIYGCNDRNYNISKGKVGKINSEIIVKQLDSIFILDSIVRRIGEGDYMFSGDDNYLIFDTQRNHLLTLTPRQQHDANETIETIEIISEKFSTKNGLTVNSNFAEILCVF